MLLPGVVVLFIVLIVRGPSSVEGGKFVDSLKYLSFENILRNASPKAASSELCAKHFEELGKNLFNVMEGDWARKMFDSSTKFPESVLGGLTTHLGNFDECINVQDVNTESGKFSGQYCLAPVNISGIFNLGRSRIVANSVTQQNGVIESEHHPENRAGMGMTSLSGSNLLLSYCIPSTCSPQDFEKIFNDFFATMDINISINMAAGGSCQTAERESLSTGDWVAVSVFIILALLAISSTTYDLLKTGPKNELLCAFSWYSNGKKLLSTKTSGDTLQALHGIRFLSMCWVVFGHRYSMSASTPATNMLSVGDILQDFWRFYLTSATLSVDTFFFLSGLLVSYIFLKTMRKRKQSFNIPLYYIHRYLRLTPPYALMILWQATLMRRISSGPLYPSTVNFLATNCQKYWWVGLLYFNNYYDPISTVPQCLAQSWYLAVDMQLFILSPIILYPLWKWPKRWSLGILSVLILAGLVTAFTISYVNELPATIFTTDPDVMNVQYVPTHTRFTPWVIGIGCGYLFVETKEKKYKLSKQLVLLGWCVGITGLLGPMLGLNTFIVRELNNLGRAAMGLPVEDPKHLAASFYTAFSRSAWAVGVAWLSYACVFGYGGPVNTFLSWKVFQPLSRLTYCVFLVHLSYQVIVAFSTRTPHFISDLVTIPGFISDMVIASFFAAILSLCVESPTIVLEKHLLGGTRKKKEEKPTIVQETKDVKENGHSTLEEVKPESRNGNMTTPNYSEAKTVNEIGFVNQIFNNPTV